MIVRQDSLYALWDITRECNFNCSYCCSPRKNSRSARISGRRLSEALGENGKNWTIHISGGEPFLYPGFIEICRELTKEFQIKVNSNLSLNSEVVEFSNSINPSRVELIETSLHIEERERLGNLEDFIRNVLLLKSRGFKVGVKAVLHPAFIERFQGDRQYLESRGVKLFPKPFKGSYSGKIYPKAYPAQIKEFLLSNTPGNPFYPFCFKGINCRAGKTFIRINLDGVVTRCLDDSAVLGNINDGFRLKDAPAPCRSYRCSCFGYDLITRKPFGKSESNYNLFCHFLSNLKYMSIRRFLSRTFPFIRRKEDNLEKPYEPR